MKLFTYILSQDSLDPSKIKPLMEPLPVPFAFETIGWTLLFWIGIVLIATIIVRFIISYQKNKYRRDALKILSNLKLDDSHKINQQIAAQLKLVAIQSYGRTAVAHLSGKDWTSFLQTKSNAIQTEHLEGFLMECLYRNKFDIAQTKQFLTYSKKWIKSHA